ncbi:phosphotransferase, partial [Streptomyces lasiicapitis]|uniref:phosphotransferase n=1 Tax=Streptomyces lasiicapitis TaxID=1923961 RepID=UPI0036C53578
EWALDVLGRIERAIAELHAQGVVFGDLQPGNVMVRPDGSVCLVDFETAFEAAPSEGGEDRGPALGTPGFTARWARSGRAVDTYGLAALTLALFCPLTPLLRFDAGKLAQLTAWTERRFPVPAGGGGGPRGARAPPPPT